MKPHAVLLVAIALAGCANPVNLRTAEKYYDAATQADLAGNVDQAAQNYDRALLNAKLGHAPAGFISAAQYGLGRMRGYQCRFPEAESLLAESLKLEETVTGPDSGITSMRLGELSRLHFDQGQYEKAVPYYARGIPSLRRLGMESSDPIALANIIDEYAQALTRVGRDADARQAKAQADEIRAKNPGKRALFAPARYRCAVRVA